MKFKLSRNNETNVIQHGGPRRSREKSVGTPRSTFNFLCVAVGSFGALPADNHVPVIRDYPVQVADIHAKNDLDTPATSPLHGDTQIFSPNPRGFWVSRALFARLCRLILDTSVGKQCC